MAENRIEAGEVANNKLEDYQPSEVVRVGAQLDQIVSEIHADLGAAAAGNLFNACSQAATTTTIALDVTYTGLCLSNPQLSRKVLEVMGVGIALSVAPAARATICLAGGYALLGVVTHTTPLAVQGAQLDPSGAVGLADAACTLPGAPRDIMPLMGAFTAAALYPHGGYHRVEGGLVIPPGGYVFIETLTVVVGFFGIIWAEWPE
jgi:hypothetical protein